MIGYSRCKPIIIDWGQTRCVLPDGTLIGGGDESSNDSAGEGEIPSYAEIIQGDYSGFHPQTNSMYIRRLLKVLVDRFLPNMDPSLPAEMTEHGNSTTLAEGILRGMCQTYRRDFGANQWLAAICNLYAPILGESGLIDAVSQQVMLESGSGRTSQSPLSSDQLSSTSSSPRVSECFTRSQPSDPPVAANEPAPALSTDSSSSHHSGSATSSGSSSHSSSSSVLDPKQAAVVEIDPRGVGWATDVRSETLPRRALRSNKTTTLYAFSM